MTNKENDNDFAFLLGSGASAEAGVRLSSEWHSLLQELPLEKKFRSSIVAVTKSLAGGPFDTGDVNDGEAVVRSIALMAAIEVAHEFRELKAALGSKQTQIADKAFRKVATKLKEMSTVEDRASLDYLRDLLHLADWRTSPGRSGFANIFTLNYDNSVETVAKSMGYSCLSMPGQYSGRTWFRRNIELRGVALLKINGSADWCFQKRDTGFGIVDTLLQGDRQWLPDVENVCFLDLVCTPWARDLATFQKEQLVQRLKETTYLVVIGYSFRRNDINKILLEWCGSSRSQQITIYDPAPSEYHSKFQAQCKGIVRCVIEPKTASAAIKSFYP